MTSAVPPPRLVISRKLPPPALALAGELFRVSLHDSEAAMPPDALARAAQDADALLIMAMDRIDGSFIAGLPETVRAIGTLSVGHEHIDLGAARARSIPVLHTPDILSEAVAEHAVLLLLGAGRRAREGDLLLRGGAWTGWSPTQLLGRQLGSARLGILGMGRIGRALARMARGLGMTIHYSNRSRLPPELEEGAAFHADPDDLLRASDFLALCAPATTETRGFLDRRRIALLPEGAVVINVARGDLVVDDDLIAALRSGRLGAAGLDVFAGEPRIHPGYLDLPNVFLQPHQGSSTVETRGRMCEILLRSLAATLKGEDVANRLA